MAEAFLRSGVRSCASKKALIMSCFLSQVDSANSPRVLILFNLMVPPQSLSTKQEVRMRENDVRSVDREHNSEKFLLSSLCS